MDADDDDALARVHRQALSNVLLAQDEGDTERYAAVDLVAFGLTPSMLASSPTEAQLPAHDYAR